MKPRRIFASVLAAGLTVAGIAACAGGRSATVPGGRNASPEYTGPLADVTLTVRIPGRGTAGTTRAPRYISSATKSLAFVINSSTTVAGTASTGTLGTYNARPWHTFDTGTLPNATCPSSGADFACTVAIKLPPGTDNVTFGAYDAAGGTGNLLSQQVQNLNVVAGIANAFAVVFDANVTTPATSIVINGSGSCQQGPVGTAFGSVGTSPVAFSVTATDAQGKTIVAPGLPKIQIQDSVGGYQTTPGTINGTGGNVAFTINQSAQTFTLTPSNSSATNAPVNVKVIQADSNGTSDGLAFNHSQSFTFSTGPAPPAHNFLAAVEQFTASTGQVDFFNVTLGGSGGPDSLSAFPAAPTLAQTTSTNQPAQKDVDGPVSLLWDNSGDLLIGNGDTTGGNVACVPVGAIATGANSSTTVTTNVDDPTSIAYEPRNGTVAIGNNPAGAPQNLAEFLLTGNYTPSTNNLKIANLGSGGGTIGGSVVNLPTLAAGTFAIALRDGCEVDPAHKAPCSTAGTSQISLFSPTGVVTNIADTATFSIDEPWGIAWDANSGQLAIGNASAWHPSIAFYTVSPVAKVKVINAPAPAGPGSNNLPYLVAASGDGHIAVAWTTPLSGDQVQVYDNTAARNPVGAPIAYNATSDAACTSYIYGPGAIPTSLTWLSNTKLLVSLQAFTGGSANAKNGLYIYDIGTLVAPAGYDDQTCTALTAAPKQTGFHQITTNKPLATAFKP